MNENENENQNLVEQDYLEAIKQLKDTTVSKEDYDKLREEHKKLLSSYLNGDNYDVPKDEEKEEEEVVKRSKEEILKSINENLAEVFTEDNHLSNLENAKAIIKYHDDYMELMGTDPFANQGNQYETSSQDKISPQKTYDYLKQCVEESGGDERAFDVAFQRGLRQIYPNKK